MHGIRLDLRPGESVVKIDGQDIAGDVRELRLDADVHDPVLRLTLGGYIEVTGEGRVTADLPESLRDTLVALGWTPPADG